MSQTTQLEMGTGRNVYYFATKIRKSLIVILIMIAGWLVISLVTRMVV
ncbi:MAG: hypothetical protein ACTSYI_17555 [Promethearchaeota archaeon]